MWRKGEITKKDRMFAWEDIDSIRVWNRSFSEDMVCDSVHSGCSNLRFSSVLSLSEYFLM
jgi:hypothetical protein